MCAVPSPGFARSRDIFSFGWWSSVERISYSALLNLFVELIVDCHRIIKGWKSMVGRKMTYCFDRAGYPSRQACNLSSLTGVDSGRDRAGWWDGFVWWNCSSSSERIFFYEVIIAGWEQCISSLGAEFYIWNTNVWSCSQKCFRLDEISTRIQMERADQKFWCAVVITPLEMFWCPCMLVKRGPLEKHTDHIATMFEKPWSIDKRRQYVWAWVLVRD